jgi:hypothetical protein
MDLPRIRAGHTSQISVGHQSVLFNLAACFLVFTLILSKNT